ncbi:hypothetical protein GCM10025867_02050 [Frondihabitans sucicola]|uniref:Extracellular solute-binding protein n=2 Tax=Frondihabitans sucicola TaxID=1268041 RepID=A0ABN6XSV2_9MICO|nr:hypothetical protein GCM10025867_02050 [Frondihabitans sucicola]
MATWPEYIATGQKYTAATGKPFLDSATQLFQDASDQGASKYVSAKGKYIYENNPVIKNAWSYATQAATDKITGGLAPDSPQWYSALANGGVATVLAPSWMLGQIESAAPKTKGLWSVATMPGGGGNNGGSFLAIPKSSPNAAAAYKFITWLEAPAQQLAAFKATADFPAIPSLYSNAAVQNYTAPFFSNASIGKVYVDSVEKYTEHPVGAKDRILEQEFQNGVGRVEKNGQSVSSSWAQTLAAAKRDQ